MAEEFDNTIRIIDCDSFGCDLYKFNGQAPCFIDPNFCPHTRKEDEE